MFYPGDLCKALRYITLLSNKRMTNQYAGLIITGTRFFVLASENMNSSYCSMNIMIISPDTFKTYWIYEPNFHVERV
jgi:hypothetical protein